MKAAAVPLALVPALGAVQGGFQPDTWVWSAALAAWAAAVAALAWSDAGLLCVQWPWPAAVGAVLVWTLLSVLWSLRPAQSILEARRTLVYAAAVLALVLLARRGSTRAIALGTCLATSGLVLYALFRYLLSARRRDPFELYTLSQPLGYANAVGILAALAILLALGIAASERGALRSAGAAAVPPLALALTLSSSNASWLALGAGLAVTAVLVPSPGRVLATAAVAAVPAAVLVALGRYSRYGADVPSPRIGGSVLAGVAVAGAVVAAVGVLLVGTEERAATRLRRLVVACVVVLALAGAGAVARAGSTEPRASYWGVAWHDYTRHPVLGSGAGTFAYAWARSGKIETRGGALDAHSLYVETLAELGPFGLALVLLALALPFRALTRSAPYGAAAAGAYAAFILHAGLDWDWEMPAVVVAGLSCGAALAAGESIRSAPLPRAARAAAVAVALVLAGCAIAGARSDTAPSAQTTKAPHRGALVWGRRLFSSQRYLP